MYMDATTMRSIVAYLAEHRRHRDNHGTAEHAAFDTTTEDDTRWQEGDLSGNERRGENCVGQGGHNL